MQIKGTHISIGTAVLLIIFLAIYFFGKGGSPSGAATPLPPQPGGATAVSNNATPGNVPAQANYPWGKQSKTSGCQVNGKLPDSACTPGAIITSATVNQICQPDYAKSVRNVTDSEKNAVYAEYGIASHTPGEYEVDHLVSLELGGSNDISNLWPEAANPKPGFHEKDGIENYLHSQLCAGKISLQDAQYKIATNWLAIYNSQH